MGPPSYFVKIRKRTIAILPPPPLSPTPFPTPWLPSHDKLTRTTQHLILSKHSNGTTQRPRADVQHLKHVSHSPCLTSHSSATNMAMDDINLTSTNLKTQYLISVLRGTAASTKERNTKYQYYPAKTNYFILVTTIQTILQRHCRSSTENFRHLTTEKAEY